MHCDQHARRVDGKGRFPIPGLIDSHVNVDHTAGLGDDAIDARLELWAAYGAQICRAYLALGFMSVVYFDLSPSDEAWFEGVRRIARRTLGGASYAASPAQQITTDLCLIT
jgi:cytosine/adenosine deaminase-related metal-dependent hydrolase